ncbi:hypothetical protein DQ04_11701020 [Trypanosoma grayi]|uniref:hypothetical protein n=1 Tax=Trypanosoma grayi TaxID=71804 RepID=UPI0004F434F7|nr:hypothetical protein DQ04_11701020 [Trypanosoma grayi]KEG06904.1 hypothetical protein DQ04_11701020 [Trypanosoma grayi]
MALHSDVTRNEPVCENGNNNTIKWNGNTSNLNHECNGAISPFEPVTPTNIPSQLIIPHRLGNTRMTLNMAQRQNREEVENEVLYRELKHNSVNTLNRYVMFLLCLLVPSLLCQLFAMCTTEWFAVSYNVHYHSVGFFLACRRSVGNLCLHRTSSKFPRLLEDSITGEIVCEMTESSANAYTITMWVLGAVQLLCVVVALFFTLRMSCRPTRSRSALVAMFFLATALPCGIANCVLFAYYTHCDRCECEALHNNPSECNAGYEWGYRVYIAAVCLDFGACITSLCLSSYPYSIRSQASQLLEKRRSHERERRTNDHASGERSHPLDFILRSVRGDVEGPAHLTAAELGVTIDGANDWVYDDKSDLFYSFNLDMFWDPLTRDYYSRALQSWQVTPDGVVGLRSAAAGRGEHTNA